MNRGFAEASESEIVIFNRYEKLLYPITPRKRNDTVRKNTVPLSVYYAGPYKVGSFDSTGYLAVVPNKGQLVEAKKLLEYRRKLEGEELKKYNAIRKSYDKYESEGFYKK